MNKSLAISVMVLTFLVSVAARQDAQVAGKSKQEVEQHIRSILAELPPNSSLRQELSNGARGNGMHQPWMDDMRKEGLRRAVVQIGINFNRQGRPKKMVVEWTEFFTEYVGGTAVSDPRKLDEIRSSGLDQMLKDIALKSAANGAWVDIPRPRPKPFNGGARLEFFDDEWLPTASVPQYCAGEYCLIRPVRQSN